jgi:O-antigen/teichoic acid export membrane protein
VSLKKNLLYNFLLSFSQVAFPLISIPYIARVLNPDGIGKVNFVDSLCYYFIVVAEFGIVTYGIRAVSRVQQDPSALKKLVSELLSLHLITSLVSTLLYAIVVFFLYDKIGDSRLVWFSLSFLLMNSFACEWYFWGTEQFGYITIRSLATRLLGLGSIFLLVKRPEHYALYYGIMVGSAVLNLLLNLYSLQAKTGFRFVYPGLKKHWPSIRITYQISLVYSIVLMLDNVFLQLVSTSMAVAYYSFAAKVTRLSGALVTDSLLVFYPRTVALVQLNDQQKLSRTLDHSIQLILLTTIPMGVGLFLVSDLLTMVYFGHDFLPLALNLRLLCLYPLLKSYGLFLNKQLLMPYDQEKLVLKGLWVGAGLFILLVFPLSHSYADKGTSIALIVSELGVVLYNYAAVRKTVPEMKLWDHKTFLQALAGSVLFIPLTFVFSQFIPGPFWALTACIIGCIFIYLLFLLFIWKHTLFSNLISQRFSSKLRA